MTPARDAGPPEYGVSCLEQDSGGGLLLLLLHASPELLRSGWFVESVVSATLIVLVIRTRGPFASSRPSLPLAVNRLPPDAR